MRLSMRRCAGLVKLPAILLLVFAIFWGSRGADGAGTVELDVVIAGDEWPRALAAASTGALRGAIAGDVGNVTRTAIGAARIRSASQGGGLVTVITFESGATQRTLAEALIRSGPHGLPRTTAVYEAALAASGKRSDREAPRTRARSASSSSSSSGGGGGLVAVTSVRRTATGVFPLSSSSTESPPPPPSSTLPPPLPSPPSSPSSSLPCSRGCIVGIAAGVTVAVCICVGAAMYFTQPRTSGNSKKDAEAARRIPYEANRRTREGAASVAGDVPLQPLAQRRHLGDTADDFSPIPRPGHDTNEEAFTAGIPRGVSVEAGEVV